MTPRASDGSARRREGSGRRAIAVAAAMVLTAGLLISQAPPSSGATSSGAVISNGTVMLGVNATGDLNYDCTGAGDTGCPAPSLSSTSDVGLRYVPNNSDGTAPGCLCEGWGAADAGSGLTGGASRDNSAPGHLTVNNFTATATNAVSDVTISDPTLPNDEMRVVQDYHPSAATPNLFEAVVTITNTGTNTLSDVRYRRAMDWDVEPTAFHEWVTIQGSSPELRFDSDDGFADVDPLAVPTYVDSESVCGSGYTGPCTFTDLGSGGTYPTATSPSDHGSLFDFGFGALAPGASRTFRIFYGAAPDETTALAAVNAAGAAIYSLGEPNCPESPPNDFADSTGCSALAAHSGVEHGQPNTFIFGFFTSAAPADVSITKTDSVDPVAASGALTYHLTVTNNGPNDASGVTVSDPLPAGTTYVSATPSQGSCSESSGTVTCPLGALANGVSATIDIAVTAPSGSGVITNTATVSTTSSDPTSSNNSASQDTTVSGGEPVNQSPSASAGGPYTGVEGSNTNVTGTASDPDSDPLTTTWAATPGAGTDAGAACTFGDIHLLATTVNCNDDGTFNLTLTADDGVNPPVTSATATLTVSNANPVVTITAPADLSSALVGSTVNLSATVTDPGSNDTQTCSIDWGDGTVEPGVLAAGVCTGSHVYGATGVETITVTATDDDGGTGQDSIDLVVVSSLTKVTGGGFIIDDGRTSFGFEAGPTDGGGLEGQLQVRMPERHRFHGDTVTTLSESGKTATWSGTGRLDGVDGYTFVVSVVDNGQGGGKDKIRDTIAITIMDASDNVVFSASGALKGGNITVHK